MRIGWATATEHRTDDIGAGRWRAAVEAVPMSRPRTGDAAPDFTLQASDGQAYTLSALRGRPVVLNFYPGDMTATCTRQMCTYSDAWDDLSATDALVFGISPQDLDSKARFTAKHDLKIPLLADVGGAVARAFGVAGPFATKRATFVIDGDGIIRWVRISVTSLSFAKPGELIEQVRALQPL